MSHAVFLPEIDDQHKEIFEAVARLQHALSSPPEAVEIPRLTEHLLLCIVGHFAHEERLMRAARYESLQWHKQKHDAARKRVQHLVRDLNQGDLQAGLTLVEYLNDWLPKHARLPDRMMAAFLRNQERSLFKLTFRAGTKPPDACTWVDSTGNTFDPLSPDRDD